MKESEKIYGKKRLPSIPSNYVTLHQLQERCIKEKERKQKGKEEPQQQEERETIVEERVNDEVSGRESRNVGRFPRLKRDNGKRVAVGKPSDEKIAVAEDFDTEVKGDGLKKKKKKKKKYWRNIKKKGMEEKARAANKGEEVKEHSGNALLPASTENNEEEEELIGDEVDAPKLSSAEEVNVKASREWQPRIIPKTHGRKAEIGQKFQAMSMDGEIRTSVLAQVPARRESQPNIIPRTHSRAAERKFQAISMDGETRTGVHAPEPASVVEENVEARRESQPNIFPRPYGRMAERKYQAMSMDGENRTRHYRRYGRQNVDFNHRRGNPELNRAYDGEFGRRRGLNQRTEGMVWVKKGEVKDQNASGIQSSSCSSKELC